MVVLELRWFWLCIAFLSSYEPQSSPNFHAPSHFHFLCSLSSWYVLDVFISELTDLFNSSEALFLLSSTRHAIFQWSPPNMFAFKKTNVPVSISSCFLIFNHTSEGWAFPILSLPLFHFNLQPIPNPDPSAHNRVVLFQLDPLHGVIRFLFPFSESWLRPLVLVHLPLYDKL